MYHNRRDGILLIATILPIAVALYGFISWYNTGSLSIPLPGFNIQIGLPTFPAGLATAISNAEAWRVPGTQTTLGSTGLGILVAGAVILTLLLLLFTLDLIDAAVRRTRRGVDEQRPPPEEPAPSVIVRYSQKSNPPRR
jgi:Na+-transporting methylmalonyl-CoA/oxaloacetate decarboxylase gamma subunit